MTYLSHAASSLRSSEGKPQQNSNGAFGVSDYIEKTVCVDTLRHWLDAMAEGLPDGRFRFCAKGSLVPTSGFASQFVTCFAMKAAWQSGIWESWPEERKFACIEFIRSFQNHDGWFHDPWLETASRPRLREWARVLLESLRGQGNISALLNWHEMNLRAETRQSASTLLMVGAVPEHPLPMPWKTPVDVLSFLKGLNWRFPWSAGSHLSHLAFILKVNNMYFPGTSVQESMFEAINEFLAEIRDKESGSWFQGKVSDRDKINGAMKVLTAWQWMDVPLPDCRRLVDLAIAQPPLSNGCGFLNRLFVVYAARRGCPSGYRLHDVKKLAQDSFQRISRFRKTDGGFSFYEKHAQTGYYGARVSKGFPISDMHGAAMMAWAIAICAELSGGGIPHLRGWRAHKA
jgi:hypothetical protein